MNWKDWLSFDLYKKLWSIIGGKPWTYIARDLWNSAEWAMQSVWLWSGVALACWIISGKINTDWWVVFRYTAKYILLLHAVYTYGYINGHIFWSSNGEKK